MDGLTKEMQIVRHNEIEPIRFQEFPCGFADYIKLKPGRAGQTVVRSVTRGNLGGDPVVVVGQVGKGRVVLSGMNIGCRSTKVDRQYSFAEELTDGERAILVNAVYWLAAGK